MKLTFLPIALLLALALGGCQRIKPQEKAFARVNGKPIELAEFDAAMQMVCGPSVLHQLVEQRLIFDEAEKQKISLKDSEIKEQLDRIEKSYHDPNVVRALETKVRADELLRRLLLKDVSNDTERRFYDLFKDELAQYEVFQISLDSLDVAKQVKIALETGSKFEDLARVSSQDMATKENGGRMGFLTWQGLAAQCGGPDAADRIVGLKENEVSQPLQFRDGRCILFKVGQRKLSFDELHDVIEDIFIQKGRKALLYRLNSEADIEDPYQPRSRSNVPLPETDAGPQSRPPSPAGADLAPPQPEPTPEFQLPGNQAPVAPPQPAK